jgi:hypothetical protein
VAARHACSNWQNSLLAAKATSSLLDQHQPFGQEQRYQAKQQRRGGNLPGYRRPRIQPEQKKEHSQAE